MRSIALLGSIFILGALILAGFTGPMTALAISHPDAYVYGTLVKDIVFGQPWQRWEDEQGVDHLLPFKVQSGQNYTINAWYINFTPQFENDTWSLSGKSTNDVWQKKIDDTGMIYYYAKNVLDDQTCTWEKIEATTDVQVPVTSTTVVLGAMKLVSNNHASDVWVTMDLTLVSGTTTYYLRIILADSKTALVTDYDDSIRTARILYPADPGSSIVFQYYIEDIFNGISGLDIDIDYIDSISLVVEIANSTTYTDEYAEAYFRFAIATDSPVYIASKDYGLLNTTSGTEIQIPTSVGDSLNIYGAKADKCFEVQIPFVYEVEPDITTYADTLKMAYTWQFQLPDDTRAGTFSGVGLNFTLNKDAGYYDYLYLNGEDKLSVIADHKAGDTVTIATGLTAGTVYVLQTRVRYTADEYDALTAAPVFWVNPVGWLAYNWWAVCAFIASIFGLVGLAKKARARARKYRVPRW